MKLGEVVVTHFDVKIRSIGHVSSVFVSCSF